MFKSYLRFLKKNFAAAQNLSYFAPQVAALYNFPTGVTGKGCKIGFIELGGGYEMSDMKTYFGQLGLPVPTIQDRLIDGSKNLPDGIDGASGEVTLDIQVALSVAPGATGVVYFAPNTNTGFLNAIKAAIADKVDVISISWGGPEDSWDSADLLAFDKVFASTSTPIMCAAGDSGSGDGESGQHVDFPGCSPHVVCCGGTSLIGNLGAEGIQSETVWNDGTQGGATGGGFSTHFARPGYQSHIGFTVNSNRGVPDLAGNADPATGYKIYLSGWYPIGGTSAVAPLMSALYCLLKEATGHSSSFLLGFLYKYTNAFRDITSGSNGSWKAAAGWDPATGLGVPDGTLLLSALKKAIGQK